MHCPPYEASRGSAQDIEALSSAMRFAEEQLIIDYVPRFPKVSVNNLKDRVVSQREEKAIIECLKERELAERARPWRQFRLLFELLIETGMRKGEALSSGPKNFIQRHWKDHHGTDKSGYWIRLTKDQTKNGKPRDIPCSTRALRVLKELHQLAVEDLWFPWPEKSSGPTYMMQNLRADMKKKGFNIDDVKLHTLRHTCASRLADGGMPLLALKDWLGHSDISITASRYVHSNDGHTFAGADILNNYMERKPKLGLKSTRF